MEVRKWIKILLLSLSIILLSIGLSQSSLILYSDHYIVKDYLAHAIITISFIVLGISGITIFVYKSKSLNK